jgi:hypothetical protein
VEEPDRELVEDAEVVDALPVVAARAELAPVPGRQVAALAATGFVAGAATVAMVRGRRARAMRRARRRRVTAFGEIVSTNSFLVDVHLLRRSE